MEDKYISKRYTGNIPGIKIYMNNNGVFKEVMPLLLRMRSLDHNTLFYKLTDLPENLQEEYEDMSVSPKELLGKKIKIEKGSEYVVDNFGTKVRVSPKTYLLPIVGNFLPSDGVNAFTVKNVNGKLELIPIIVCVNCHWSELFTGQTKYKNNVFCLVSDLDPESIDNFVDKIITLEQVPEYIATAEEYKYGIIK